jgi:predicted transcriptional regulator
MAMVSTTVRITDEMRATLRQLAEEEHETMQAILARALERYRRERMFERADEVYAAMTAEEWAEEEAERALWDTTLMDGLEDDETEQ